jgi:hypothetical protein
VIEPSKTWIISICFFLLLAFSAYAQQPAPAPELPPEESRGYLGVDFGAIRDHFGPLPAATTGVGEINGEYAIYQGEARQQSPDIYLGGQVRLPTGTAQHANEFAGFVGPMFHFTDRFMAGFHVQVRRIDLPNSVYDNQTFIRNNMLLLELPLVLNYKFGADKNYFVEAQIVPEFHPHFSKSSSGPSPYPHPSLDHGYTLRGIVGRNFGSWYVRGAYETRFFKFSPTLGNPYNLYSWRSDTATVGVGLSF